MAHVTGIGGVFFAADDPEASTRWYADHLTITPPPSDYDAEPWQQQPGPTIFAPMARGGDHVERGWSIDLRVDDREAMAAQLRAAGVDVRVDPEPYPNGRFAELSDPEGNLVQLWHPSL